MFMIGASHIYHGRHDVFTSGCLNMVWTHHTHHATDYVTTLLLSWVALSSWNHDDTCHVYRRFFNMIKTYDRWPRWCVDPNTNTQYSSWCCIVIINTMALLLSWQKHWLDHDDVAYLSFNRDGTCYLHRRCLYHDKHIRHWSGWCSAHDGHDNVASWWAATDYFVTLFLPRRWNNGYFITVALHHRSERTCTPTIACQMEWHAWCLNHDVVHHGVSYLAW